MYVSSRSLSALRVCKQKKRSGKREGKRERTGIRWTEGSLHNPYSTNSRVIATLRWCNFVAIQICLDTAFATNGNGIKFIGTQKGKNEITPSRVVSFKVNFHSLTSISQLIFYYFTRSYLPFRPLWNRFPPKFSHRFNRSMIRIWFDRF